MKIGILTYHAACNFGAFLQLLSTVECVRNQGYEPRVINWVPQDFENDYLKRSDQNVRDLYLNLREQYFQMTKLCRTSKDIAQVIIEEDIQGVIIGSDAVIQHHPLRERIHFPCRRIIFIHRMTCDRLFPNAFWGDFDKYLSKKIPFAMISGASVDSKYFYIKGKIKERMSKYIQRFSYFSVRDEWSKDMIGYITDGKLSPDVTPDPVFAFNYNANKYIPTKEEILNKYKLPVNYLLLSFKKSRNTSINQQWIEEFQNIAKTHGLACVKLPYPDIDAFGEIEYNVDKTISPLDWYALIKYSQGYIGNNMHPIIVSLHNAVPFYSFDNYGIKKLNGKATNGESSKVYQILKLAEMENCRVFAESLTYISPAPSLVFDRILNFDKDKVSKFSEFYYKKYKKMMDTVFGVLDRTINCKL